MKSLNDIQTTLNAFEQKYKVPIMEIQQGSEAWLKVKLGVISASNASRAVAKKDSATRRTYMCELVAEVCTGVIEEINARAIAWGRENESAALSSYEFDTGETVSRIPFIFKDDSFRTGCSVDGLILDKRGWENKCPWDTTHFIKFVDGSDIKDAYDWQVNFSMWVTDYSQWDVSMFDPRMKKKMQHTVTFDRDEKKIATLNDAIPQFVSDMDKMLEKMGCTFGNQWVL